VCSRFLPDRWRGRIPGQQRATRGQLVSDYPPEREPAGRDTRAGERGQLSGHDFRKIGKRWISLSFPCLPADSWQPMKERRACFLSEGGESASNPRKAREPGEKSGGPSFCAASGASGKEPERIPGREKCRIFFPSLFPADRWRPFLLCCEWWDNKEKLLYHSEL
jgi:hypothetical protein